MKERYKARDTIAPLLFNIALEIAVLQSDRNNWDNIL
jgi:hypothetical protein